MQISSVKKINHIPMIVVFSLVLVLGVAFLVSFLVFDKKIPENYVEVEATIEDIKETKIDDEWQYDVYISYSYNDTSYSNKEYSKYDSSMKEGKKVTIYVNPDNAEEFLADDSDDFIFPLLSGIFALIGVIGLVYNIKKLVDLRKGEKDNVNVHSI